MIDQQHQQTSTGQAQYAHLNHLQVWRNLPTVNAIMAGVVVVVSEDAHGNAQSRTKDQSQSVMDNLEPNMLSQNGMHHS